jgi:pyruvate/2-oxoglutarate dehydrogenase complex dihydrolipoamide acyltransferase (E2) component
MEEVRRVLEKCRQVFENYWKKDGRFLRKHHIAGLLEVDVTNSLTRLKERGDAKEGASFFAWIIFKAMHNLCFALGSIVKKPRVIEHEIRIRDVLHLTILFDHDVVDGIPAARFAARFVKRVEEGS